jgi:5-methylcytosine-specific restriction endonuclease McrA
LQAGQQTNRRVPPQPAALEPRSADKPRGGHETGSQRAGNGASGFPQGARAQHGREGTSPDKAGVTRGSGVSSTQGVQRVFVLDRRGNPLMPCHPARARELLRKGRAVIHRRAPFTIRLKDRDGGTVQPVRLGVDPGSKATGMALTCQDGGTRTIIALLEVTHRSNEIHKRMGQRAAYRRRRRSANLRYRAPRFLNRTKPEGWLAPSLRSRVQHIETWARRFQRWCPVTAIDLELVRFDMQALQNPEISGAEYQQGTLAGYEVKNYLLEKWHRKCAYCDAENVPLNIDHVVPRSRGGSNRVSNLVLACIPCNQAKDRRPVEVFVTDPARLAKILRQAKAPLCDAAAVNSTRFAVLAVLRGLGIPVECWSGGRTKWNRHRTSTPKTHALDAACCGEMDALTGIAAGTCAVKAMGRGKHQRAAPDAYGFPRLRRPRSKRIRGFQTGDLVRAVVPRGQHAGTHTGRVAVRATGSFRVGRRDGINHRYCTILQRSDGYEYVA